MSFQIIFYYWLSIYAVPPDIDEKTTSSDISVLEGSNITLTCVAHGLPSPKVKYIFLTQNVIHSVIFCLMIILILLKLVQMTERKVEIRSNLLNN